MTASGAALRTAPPPQRSRNAVQMAPSSAPAANCRDAARAVEDACWLASSPACSRMSEAASFPASV